MRRNKKTCLVELAPLSLLLRKQFFCDRLSCEHKYVFALCSVLGHCELQTNENKKFYILLVIRNYDKSVERMRTTHAFCRSGFRHLHSHIEILRLSQIYYLLNGAHCCHVLASDVVCLHPKPRSHNRQGAPIRRRSALNLQDEQQTAH